MVQPDGDGSAAEVQHGYTWIPLRRGLVAGADASAMHDARLSPIAALLNISRGLG